MSADSWDTKKKGQSDQGEQPPDMLLLYWTLVAEGTVPSGYVGEFLELGAAMKQASDRLNRRSAQEDNMSAAVWLHITESQKPRK